jgi:hypothetical protein
MRLRRAAFAAVVMTLGWPASADAACSSAWVSFTEVAPSAARVLIGTVANAQALEGDGYASVFHVTVEEILRGPHVAVVEVNEAVNNPACGTVILARDGDRIALAMGGSALGSDNLSAVAYLAGVPHRPDIEMMSRAEAYAAADIELPDTALWSSRRTAPLGWLLVVSAALIVARQRWLTGRALTARRGRG